MGKVIGGPDVGMEKPWIQVHRKYVTLLDEGLVRQCELLAHGQFIQYFSHLIVASFMAVKIAF